VNKTWFHFGDLDMITDSKQMITESNRVQWTHYLRSNIFLTLSPERQSARMTKLQITS